MKPNLLKSKRVEQGLNQKQVAKTLEIDVSTYSKKENGIIPFRANEIAELKYLLKLTPETIDKIFFTKKVEFNSTEVI